MLSFKKIELSDRAFLLNATRKAGFEISNYGFNYMWIWHDWFQTEFALSGDALFFRYTYPDKRDQPIMSCPVVANESQQFDALRIATDDQKENGLDTKICSVPDWLIEKLVAEKSMQFDHCENEDFGDYVYERQVLAELRGKAMHGKRNHVNRFKKDYPNHLYRALNAQDAQECLEMHMRWWQERDMDPQYKAERGAIERAFTYMDELELLSGGLWVDQKLVAFTIANQNTADMVNVNFEKALESLAGAYAAINQMFCQSLPAEIRWINREEDMGIEGLRTAKLSYKPARMLRKYTFIAK
jgi:hypothetical protein